MLKRGLAVVVSIIVTLASSGPFSPVQAQGQPVTFSAMGDIPYGSSEYAILRQHVADHNRYSPSAFVIHIGDMMTGSCDESKYAEVAGILKGFAAPVYLVVGDNEYNDCSNPAQAFGFWKKYFLNFERNFCGAPAPAQQSVRPENLAFMKDGVLFIGINLVGGTVHDQNEWNTRMQQDADWVSQQLQTEISTARAAVVFAHAGPEGSENNRVLFLDQFRLAAKTFGQPVLFIQGNSHNYKLAQPWPEKNITQLVVPKGNVEPPLEVTVTMNSNPSSAFAVKRHPWGSTPFNMPPCVNAGFDQTVSSGSMATLQGGATDDGDSTGNFTTTWSRSSGPGNVTFGNAQALTTTAHFSLPGIYVLSLTATDGQLQKSDEVSIVVESTGPTLSINDVTVNEGNSGTSAAVFTVSLALPNGQPATVDYQIVNGTATNNDDYVAAPNSGTLAFNGATTQTIAVTINGDAVDEPQDETFFINLSNPINATISDNQGVGTIVNDDQPAPPIAPGNLSASANSPTSLTLTWSDQATDESGFKIERKVAGIFNQIAVVAADVVSFTDNGLNSNTAYTYRVRAYNIAGNSAYSNEVSVSTPGVSSLTVNTNGSGAVVVDPASEVYLNGTVVTLTATPMAGFRFGGWSGDLTGVDNPVALTMNQNKTVTATFIRVVTLTANVLGSGTITLDPAGGLYDAGMTVTISATPAAGFRFTGWSGDLSGSSNPATLLLNDNKTITAIFTRVLTVTTNIVGSGTVALNPAGGIYDENTVVTLTAVPAPGFQFNGWSGDLSGTSNPANLTMDAHKIVTASFTPLPIGIAHHETRIGGISGATTVTTLGNLTGVNGHLYLAAISMRPKVSVFAVSGLGLNWTLVKAKCAGRNTTAIEVWMARGMPTTNGPVTATFAGVPSTATIAVSSYSGVAEPTPIGSILAGNTNGVNAGGACSGGVDNNAYSFNLNVTTSGAVIYGAAAIKGATHTPGQNYIERAEVLQAAGTNTSGVAVEEKMFETVGLFSVNGVLGAAVDWAFVALEIKPQLFTLALNTVGSGNITLDTPSGIYRTGVSATLPAMPAAGFQFSGWSGDLTGSVNPATLIMNANKNVTAIFTASPPPRALTVNTVGAGNVVVNPAREFYDDGLTITLTATPAAGFQFTGWSGDLTGSANPATLTMNADKNVTATFTILPPTQYILTINALGSGNVSLNPAGGIYNEDTVVTLTPLAAAGFQFTGWSGDLTGSLNPATITMNANKAVNATFIATNANLAKRRPMTASSTYSGKPPENTVDSSASTYWRSATTSQPVWLRVDLGAPTTVGRVTINWYKSYYAKNYEIQISNDDVNWQRVTSASGKSGVQTFSFSSQTAQYVRLYFTKSNSSSYRVAEFEAYYGVATTSKRGSEEMTETAMPDELVLQQNYPNPFNPSTKISFNLPSRLAGSHVTIKVYTINGAAVATIVDDRYVAGAHEVLFKPKHLPSGIYFYVMQAGDVRQVRRFSLIK